MKQSYAEVVKNIPSHLRHYIVDQDYSRYTPIDQATWRFSLRQLKNFLSKNAHEKYAEGLEKTGILVTEIPHIDVMCEKLQKFGWSVVPVSGFIPPAAFMELQSLSILPIASDMRTVDHILYTPAPDIVHEAAGHAPMLVDEKFAQYLKSYAQVAKKAIISSEDLAQYEAIRELSDIKEDSNSTAEQIEAAEKKLNDVNASISHISEAALLGRMNWWTAEYGLIGDIKNPKIFGAGLLSSLGEARSCLLPNVEKIPLSVDCVETSYDITEKQPQLYVAQTFDDLERVLKDLENRMAFRIGGATGLERAQTAKTVNTVQLNSDLQISGRLTDFYVDESNEPYFIKFEGPAQLAYKDEQLDGHGVDYHEHGFSSPIGLLQNSIECMSVMSDKELSQLGIEQDLACKLQFASGITVEGKLIGSTRNDGKLQILTFDNCTVKNGEKILFQPDWGLFDMAVGCKVDSVFGGPADRNAFGMMESFAQKIIPRKSYSPMEEFKHSIYRDLRDMREKKKPIDAKAIGSALEQLRSKTPDEWLAFLEILELSYRYPELSDFTGPATRELERIEKSSPEKSEYIQLGLNLASKIV